MAWRTTADPERFNEAVDWFANRVPVAFWQSVLGPATARRAFTVAGVVELDVVTAIWALLTETIANGDGLDVFKRRARDEIARWRASGDLLETVYRTNVQTAYNRGRWHQMGRPEVVRHRPYWLYDAVMDLRTTRDICRPLNGTIRQHSSTFWQTHHPPLHHRCRSALRALTPRQAERRGITADEDLPSVERGEGFGGIPELDEWKPDPSKYPPALWDAHVRRSGRPR